MLLLPSYASPQRIWRIWWSTSENLANMVEYIVQELAQTWERAGRQTRVVCHAPLAVLRLDWKQIGKALKQVAACAYALLPAQGGEVIIEAGLRKVGPQQHLDLKIRSCSIWTSRFAAAASGPQDSQLWSHPFSHRSGCAFPAFYLGEGLSTRAQFGPGATNREPPAWANLFPTDQSPAKLLHSSLSRLKQFAVIEDLSHFLI